MVTVRRHRRLPWLAMIDPGDAVPVLKGFLCSYVLLREKVAVVDVGPPCCIPALLEGLRQLGVSRERVYYLLTSHIHLDHGGGIGHALRELPSAKAVVHPAGVGHLEKPWKLWEASLKTLGDLARSYGEPSPAPADRLVAAVDGMEVDLGDAALRVLFTPGHAPHHMSFFDEASRLLLAGELVGVRARGVRRPATPPPLYLDRQLASLDRAIALRPKSLCYGHYGWESCAAGRLQTHRRMLVRWRNYVSRRLVEGLSQEQIAEELIRVEKGLAAIPDLPADLAGAETIFVRNAVAGMAGHLQREQASSGNLP